MFRMPKWQFMLLAPFIFFGGCTTSLPYVWKWRERDMIKPVGANEDHFPVLVINDDGKYDVKILDANPNPSSFVLSNFDEAKINRDLNASIGGTGNHRYFEVLAQTPGSASVVVEQPRLHESKLK